MNVWVVFDYLRTNWDLVLKSLQLEKLRKNTHSSWQVSIFDYGRGAYYTLIDNLILVFSGQGMPKFLVRFLGASNIHRDFLGKSTQIAEVLFADRFQIYCHG